VVGDCGGGVLWFIFFFCWCFLVVLFFEGCLCFGWGIGVGLCFLFSLMGVVRGVGVVLGCLPPPTKTPPPTPQQPPPPPPTPPPPPSPPPPQPPPNKQTIKIQGVGGERNWGNGYAGLLFKIKDLKKPKNYRRELMHEQGRLFKFNRNVGESQGVVYALKRKHISKKALKKTSLGRGGGGTASGEKSLQEGNLTRKGVQGYTWRPEASGGLLISGQGNQVNVFKRGERGKKKDRKLVGQLNRRGIKIERLKNTQQSRVFHLRRLGLQYGVP